MKKLQIFIVGLFFASFSMFSQPGRSLEPTVCDIKDIQSVFWVALGETVTVTTHLTTGNPYPKATFTMQFEDGHIVDLGGGRKFIDDYTEDTIPTCEDHFPVATTKLLNSLKDQWRTLYFGRKTNTRVRITDFIADFTASEITNLPGCDAVYEARKTLFAEPVPYDKEARRIRMQKRRQSEIDLFLCEKRIEILSSYKDDPEILRRLIEEDAPLIIITRSTYQTHYMAFDRNSRLFYSLVSTGD